MSKQTGNGAIEDVSTAFGLLRDARRRGVLYAVTRNGRTSVEALARRIATWQSEAGRGASEPETVETGLVHSHLPKLDDAGVIEYDRERGIVEPTEAVEDVEPFLERAREYESALFHTARTPSVDSASEVGP